MLYILINKCYPFTYNGANSISGTIVPIHLRRLEPNWLYIERVLLQGVKGRNGSKTIDTVYCNFQRSDWTEQRSLSSPSGLNLNDIILIFNSYKSLKYYSIVSENRIGYVDIKSSSGVYVYAFSQNGRVAKSGTLLFDKSYLNIGNAMDTSIGVFTAPKSGIYHFSFSVLKEGYAKRLHRRFGSPSPERK